MYGSQITFHGDVQDMRPLFEEWFGEGRLFIAETLSDVNKDIVVGSTPDFATARLLKPRATYSDPWVVGPIDRPLVLTKVVMADGSGTKKKVGLSNRFVVGLRFGGQTDERELQPTVLSTSGDDPSAVELYKRLKKSITKRAVHIGLCWLLPGARAKLEQGWRLTRGQFQAPFTDLKLP